MLYSPYPKVTAATKLVVATYWGGFLLLMLSAHVCLKFLTNTLMAKGPCNIQSSDVILSGRRDIN